MTIRFRKRTPEEITARRFLMALADYVAVMDEQPQLLFTEGESTSAAEARKPKMDPKRTAAIIKGVVREARQPNNNQV